MNRRQMLLLTGGMALSGVTRGAGPAPKAAPYPSLFEPIHFGAKGDGSALDSSAINAAIEACTNAGGGVVFLRPGTYRSGTVH